MSKLQGALGLAAKAGAVVAGFQAVCDAVKGGRVGLVLVSSAMSLNSAEKVERVCVSCNVECIKVDIDDMGAAIGRSNKLVVGITNKNFVNMINGVYRGGTVEHE